MNLKQTWRYFIFTSGLLLPLLLHAQKDTLPVVKIISQESTDISRTAVPFQQLTKKELASLNSLSVADAVKYFSGVLIKDYGGIGGLKTISVRSLGANHTGIMYDGIMVGDAQGGQIDLGRFSLDNIETIQLSTSRPETILMAARSYASAAVLSLSSSTANIQKRSMTLKLKGGSFGFFNPAFSFKDKIGERFGHGVSAEYQAADGDYSYKNYVAGDADSKRLNADIKTYRAEYDASYLFNDSNQIKLKLYYYNAKRGLPGAVILYNNFSNQRLNNEIFFSQASWKKNISGRSKILFNAKFTKDYKYYLDPSYQNSVGKFENKFNQQELYVSGAYSYQFSPALSASYAADYFNSKLKRTDDFAAGFADPERDNFLYNIAVDYSAKRLNLTANILHTILNERVQNGSTGRKLNELSPAAALSYHFSDSSPLHARVFYKRIFRAPTFDDLYYTNVGNTDLKPEFVDQYNIGLSFNKKSLKNIEGLIITLDIYYNQVKDKILAVPRQNLFQWTMLNIGQVEIKGVDATVLAKWKQLGSIFLTSRLSYTYQDARDMSDPSSAVYKKQIPYTPKHSAAVGIGISYRNLDLSYNVLLSSYRHSLGDQVPENLAKEWATQDLTFMYSLKTKYNNNYRITAELNNIFNKQYEVIKFYPMPRFNYRIGIIATFNQS
ncbi:MAG: TonB-dependent receptor [Rhizobacter sp.]|nr:TonB-dependent receptor [Ferruginibacter sp.]